MPAPPTLALIDASGFLYRAFFAIRGLSGPGGRPTNATFGFTNMLRKFLAERRPHAVAVAFDRKEKTFRHEMDENYKAQRAPMPEDLVPQVADARRLCEAMGLAVVEEPGFEADDLIGTLAERAFRAGLKVEIASADKDLFQLVRGEQVVVWHPTKEVVLDAKGVTELFGVPPERVVDVLALMGDASDNIPGVAGIGEKGAKELIVQFGSLDELLSHLTEVKGKRREHLENGRSEALRSRELATVRRDCPAPGGETVNSLMAAYGVREPDTARTQRLASLYEEFGFSRLRKELLVDAVPGGEPAPPARPSVETASWVSSLPDLERLVDRVVRCGRFAVHVESAPGRPFPAIPLAAAVAVPEGPAWAFSLTGGDAGGRETLGRLLVLPDVTVEGHGLKKVYLAALELGLRLPGKIFDAMLGAYVDAPGLRAHDLAGDAREILGLPPEAVPSPKDVTGTAAFESLDLLKSGGGLTYLASRARTPLLLADRLRASWKERASTADRILEEIEFPLIGVLARMERTGIAVDRALLSSMSGEFDGRIRTLEAEIHAAAGETFNIASSQQLGRILFDKLGYPVLRKTAKTKAYATGSDVLEELVARHGGPLPGLVLQWREISKLKGTYVDALPGHIAADGRVHTRFDQAVAATGRLSSNDPNLQNIPIRTEAGRSIRRAFVAPPGRLLVAADYSQIELRILAHLSGDEALIDVFRRGEDIHQATAAKVFGIDPGLVSPDQRRGAKTINFGILYGMGPFALAGQLGVSQADAKAFIAAYFRRFPKIKGCLDEILAEAHATGRTRTIFGRERPIPGLSDRNHAIRSNAERMAMNAPFQGSAADLIKKAMVVLEGRLAEAVPTARLLLQVHDELVLECDEADAPAVGRLTRDTMAGAAALAVPLTVDVGMGRNWADAK